MAQQMVDVISTVGQVLRSYAPAYLSRVGPVMSQFMADQHRMLEQYLSHIEDRNTRAVVAAMLLLATRAGSYSVATEAAGEAMEYFRPSPPVGLK